MANKVDETKRRRILVTRDYVNIGYLFYNKTFEEAAEALEEVRMKYIEYIVLHNYDVRFDSRGYIEVMRDENDIEFKKRIDKLIKSRASAEKRRQAALVATEAKRALVEKRERELLKQLKEKYESV